MLFVVMGLTTAEGDLPLGKDVIGPYSQGGSFDKFVIPANLEIVSRFLVGLESFFSTENIEILQNDGLDLADMVFSDPIAFQSAVRSSKKKLDLG